MKTNSRHHAIRTSHLLLVALVLVAMMVGFARQAAPEPSPTMEGAETLGKIGQIRAN